MRNKIKITFSIFTLTLLLTACKDKNSEIERPYTPSSLIELKIGTQIWSANNLDVSNFQNGDEIPQAKTPNDWQFAGETGNPVWCYYNYDLSNGKKSAKLYNWYAVHDKRKLAPLGWHVSTYAEWFTLISYLTNNSFGYQGSGDDVAKSMAATSGWEYSSIPGSVGNNQTSNNSTGFTAIPGGTCGPKGKFYYMGSLSAYWSYSSKSTYNAYVFSLIDSSEKIFEQGGDGGRESGYSVRCVKDLFAGN